MIAGTTCKDCGTVIPADSAGGWCPQCLLSLGLDTERPAESFDAAGETEPQFASPTGEPGERIGRYRLIEEIGHGGCGIVYLAEQREPVRRQVAFKVIKLGMDTREVVARFEAERQALALMDHPNIARVFDGGTIGDAGSQLSSPNPQLFLGRPYFVMEMVAGIPITDYCDKNHLSARQRLDLFMQVCHAIQHAHQKGIIHRDIKPSNVLVTSQDGLPVPKVIDFGIAKAVQGRLTDQTVYTALEQFIGTPAYMSPEQAQFGGLDVDTRSDIYSLGVLLYELLTGKTPFNSKELLALGVEKMRQTIQEKRPPLPSSRLRQELNARATAAGDPALAKPQPELDKDLDWIVMKCLEKDRARRYETANGLARDLVRYLRNEPVTARPPSRVYTLRKAVERNKAAFALGTLTALVLVLGVVGSTWQAIRATRAERRENIFLAQMQAVEIGRAEQYFDAEDRRNMLPNLALVLRQNPENRVAAERLMSALTHRIWSRLSSPPLAHSARLTWAMFDKSGSRVLTSSADHTARIWHVPSGQPLGEPFSHSEEINNADFSGDGRYVVTSSRDRTARVWDSYTGGHLGEPLMHSNDVQLAKFSPTEKLVMTASSDQAFLWEPVSGKTRVLKCADFIEDGCFSPDGTRVAIACSNGVAQVWDVVSGDCLHVLQHAKRVKSVAFSPNGNQLVTGSYDRTAQVWDVQSGERVGEPLMHEGTILSAEFSPDAQRVITTSADRTAQMWDVATSIKLGRALTNNWDVRSAMFSPEACRIVTTANQLARVWETFSSTALTEPMIHEYGAFQAQFHPDGERVLTASNGKAALIWQTIGAPALTLFFPKAVRCFDFSPDSKGLVTACDAAHTGVWDPWTGRALTPPLADQDKRDVSQAVFSANGKLIATADENAGLVRIWDAATGKPVTAYLEHSTVVSNLWFSPDSSRLLSSSPRRMCLWDIETGKLVLGRDFGGLTGSPAFSADGEVFLGLIDRNIAQVFSTRTGAEMSQPLVHKAAITSAMFSPDGKSLLTTAIGELSFLIWDFKAGRVTRSSFLHRDAPSSACYSSDGKRVLTRAEQYRAQIWDVENEVSLTGEFGRLYVTNALFSGDGSRVVLTFVGGNAQLFDGTSGSRLSEMLPAGKYPVCTRLSPDGRLLAISSEEEKKITIWEIPAMKLPVPAWLPELAEALSAQRFNARGDLELVPPTELWALQQKLIALASADGGRTYYGRWLKWFFADPATRTVLPSSPLTIPEYAQFLLQQSIPQAWQHALLLQPTNALALAKVGGSTSNLALADWMTQRAAEMAPASVEVAAERERVLTKLRKIVDRRSARLELKP